MAGRFERRTEIAMVIDFAVVDDREIARLIEHRLMAVAGDVNDAEPAMP